MCLGLVPLMHTAAHIAVPLFLAGCVAATVWVPMVAVVQDSIPSKHQGKVLGLISSGTAYGLFLNGFSVPLLLPVGGWQSVWVFSAALTLLLLVWGWLRLPIREDKPVQREASTPSAQGSASGWKMVRHEPVALLVVLMMFLNGMACMPTMNYLLAFLREEIGYSVKVAGRVGSTIGLVGMFGGFAMGALADRITVARALNVTYLVLGAATVLFLHHSAIWEVLLGAALFGLAFNAIFGLIPAFVSQTFAAQQATTVFALSNFMLGLGSMLGNLLGGMLREYQQSFMPVYVATLCLNVVLVCLSLYLHPAALRRARVRP